MTACKFSKVGHLLAIGRSAHYDDEDNEIYPAMLFVFSIPADPSDISDEIEEPQLIFQEELPGIPVSIIFTVGSKPRRSDINSHLFVACNNSNRPIITSWRISNCDTDGTTVYCFCFCFFYVQSLIL